MVAKQSFRLPPTSASDTATVPKIVDTEAAQRFIDGPDQSAAAPAAASPGASIAKPPKANPWEGQDDSTRGRSPGSVFNMRFTDREHACLEFIRKKTPFSKHAFVIAALRPALAAKIKELTGEDISELLREPEEE